jgi:hypothetical protein
MSALVLTTIANTRTDTAEAAVTTNPTSGIVTSEWSAPERGLSGRLQVEREDLGAALRYAVYLELRNDSLEPIAVTDEPRVEAGLRDEAGKVVEPFEQPMSGPSPNAQWAVIPRGAVLRLRIDMQTVGVPEKKTGLALLAAGGRSWVLGAGNYALKLRALFESEAVSGNQWIGALTLPSVSVMVRQ